MKERNGISRRDVLKLAGSGLVGVALSGVSFAEDGAFKLPPLPYAEDALEPHIDALTMSIHHGKHHAGYTAKLNAAIEGTELVGMSIEDILADLDAVPEDIRTAVRNNGGGYANHNLYWQIMSPAGGGEPSGELARAIEGKRLGAAPNSKRRLRLRRAACSALAGPGWSRMAAR